MDTISWFGTPVTVPLPVTVIRPAVCDEVRVAALAAGVPLDALLPSWVPMANAPISSAAAATPVAAARYLGGVLRAMTVLLLRGVLHPLGRGPGRPGSARRSERAGGHLRKAARAGMKLRSRVTVMWPRSLMSCRRLPAMSWAVCSNRPGL